MPLYVWTITFEADDRDEADEIVDEATKAFHSVVRERLAEDADD
jgi:hypothetical protein